MQIPETIHLLQQLPAQPELLSLNRRLSANEICLDWCAVRLDLVRDEQLDTLLHGLTLYEHSACIDASNNTAISDALFPLIMATFERAEHDLDATITRPARTNQNHPTPALWTPDFENEAERTITRKWHPDRKTFVKDSTQPLIETPTNDTTNTYQPASSFLPVYEMPCDETPNDAHNPVLAASGLSMLTLKQAGMAQLPPLLQPLVNTYARWIEEQARRISRPAQEKPHRRVEAQRIIQHYRATLQRIRESIELISTDQKVAQTFAFMNRVMELQLTHSALIQEHYSSGVDTTTSIGQPTACNWQPFQLAFILLNIPALIDASSVDRETTHGALADLRWFPTDWSGADAYLGLTAYTLGIRRLQDSIGGSFGAGRVTAILRYTSCELTSQQFQRVTALICACEISRRADSSTWGKTPFRLGLSAHLKFAELLTRCPWCGSAIETSSENTPESSKGRTLIYCRNPKNACAFSQGRSSGEGLPFLITDKAHDLRPGLLIIAEV